VIISDARGLQIRTTLESWPCLL